MENQDKKSKKTLDKSEKEKQKGRTMTGQPVTQIDVNPETDGSISEAVGRTAVVTWGRMNPPTVGHQRLVDKVVDTARKMRAIPHIFLTHTQDKKKNPLTYADKIRLAKKAFGSIVKTTNAKTLIELMKKLENKYENVVLVAGSDRVKEFDTLLNKYNGKEYNFDNIQVVSAGERDPDAEGVSGMSASKMRAAVKDDNIDRFKNGLPAKLKAHAQEMFDLIKAGMQIAEELEAEGVLELSEGMSVAQRMKRKQIMRRYKARIGLARKRAMRRKASMSTLRRRARKQAIKKVKTRIAGGRDIAHLSAGEKSRIEDMVKRKRKLVARLTTKMVKDARKRDAERQRAQFKEQTTRQDPDIESRKGTQPARYHKGLAPSTKAARDAQFKKQTKMASDDPRAYKPAPGDKEAETRASKYTKTYKQMFGKKKEAYGDMDWGTDSLRKKYQKDTPGQQVNEIAPAIAHAARVAAPAITKIGHSLSKNPGGTPSTAAADAAYKRAKQVNTPYKSMGSNSAGKSPLDKIKTGKVRNINLPINDSIEEQDLAKQKKQQHKMEVQRLKAKHDREMDRARLADARFKNRQEDFSMFRESYNKWIHKQPVEYAKHLEKTFGSPDEITNSQLCWFAKDGFKRIVIKDEYVLHSSPAPHYDFIYCYIDLQVPKTLADDLAMSSGSILIDFLKGEVGARCGSITANATTLNYVMDVVSGRVAPSKQEYERRILEMQQMFDNGEKYSLEWWSDETNDADPENPYYLEESIQEDFSIDEALEFVALVEGELSESKAALQKKAQASGESYATLKKVYDRGVAAWRTGHRPGTTPAQWGMARVNAFIVKKKKGGLNHDKDLA